MQPPAFRRRVFFVSGFDPNGPRRYHGLYRRESARSASPCCDRIEVGRLSLSREAAEWTVRSPETEAAFVMLRWDDIARARMRVGTVSLYMTLIRTFRRYVFSGAFARLFRLRRVSTLVGLYPPLMMLFYLAVAAGCALLAASGLDALGVPVPLTVLAGAGAALATLGLARRMDGATLAFYLMADLGFTADHAAGEAPEMEARIDRFAGRIGGALDEGWDEVLVVGHSSGAAYAASAAARALEAAGPDAALSMLTLGQTIPMLSFLPGAKNLRAELAALAREPRLAWVDVSSPADGGCYALADPVAVSGATPGDNPKVISARFGDALSAQTLRALRWRWFRKHVLYLCRFERPAGYDYFAITAGPLSLAARFADRRPSPRACRVDHFS